MLIPYAATYGLRLLAPLLPEVLWRRETDERVVYLTFDDGPTEEMTTTLLDLLDRHDAQATFFLIGAHARRHPDLVRALAAAGHTLGNHSFTHPNPWLTPSGEMIGELERTNTLVEDATQQPLRLMRPPYGHLTPALLHWCGRRGRHLVMWDVMPGDFLSSVTAPRVEHFVRRTLRPGSVVVLHDNPIAREVTLPALRALLPALKADGWRFAAL